MLKSNSKKKNPPANIPLNDQILKDEEGNKLLIHYDARGPSLCNKVKKIH